MNILWLAPFPHINDKFVHPAPWITMLAKEISKAENINLTILNYNHRIKNRIEEYKKDNIKFIYIKALHPKIDTLTAFYFRINKMSGFIRSNYMNYDLIHVHGSEHQYEVMCKNLDVPVIISIQGVISIIQKKLKTTGWKKIIWKIGNYYEKKYLKDFNYFLCRTNWDTNFVKNINPKAVIFKNWELIRPDFFSDLKLNNKKNIIFIGGTNQIKGIDIFLETFEIVRESIKIGAIIIGNTNLELIKTIIKDKRLINFSFDDLLVKGYQDAEGIIKSYQEAFCLVHPSYIDNSPNSVCEAQVAGLPVVATNVGGVGSLIEDGVTGFLTNLDPKNIAARIITLHSDNSIWNNISQNSKVVARARHNKTFILNKTVEIYNKIISDRNLS